MVIGKRNSTYQTLDALKRNRVKRRQTGSFLVEGVKPIETLIAQGWTVQGLVYDVDRSLSRWATELIRDHSDAKQYELSTELMSELSDRDETSELIVVAERRDFTIPSLPNSGTTILLDRPSNPGNTGSIFRSADAFGVDSVIVSGHGVDPYDSRVIRSSIGAVFSVPFALDVSNAELEQWVERERSATPEFTVIGTSAHGSVELDQIDISAHTLLVIGNETHGMSRFSTDLCDIVARIPMGGTVSSLNVACAASVVLYEVSKQQRSQDE